MPDPAPESLQRTRAFARVIGPFVALATVIVAIRLPDLTGLVNDLFANAVLPWILGAMMLACGLLVIAFHQYWSSVAAVLISLFGWFVALRGLTLMVGNPDRCRRDNDQLRATDRCADLLRTADGDGSVAFVRRLATTEACG
jgi:hypothetical protein